MDKFQEKYIKLSKDYYKNNGNAASVEALYQFKEELEASKDLQAKSVLVDISAFVYAKECLRATFKDTR